MKKYQQNYYSSIYASVHQYYFFILQQLSMLQELRKRRCFKIKEGFVFVNLVDSVLQIDYMNAKQQNQLYRAKYVKYLPDRLAYYFLGINSLYEYLTEEPHKMINATQKRIQVALESFNRHFLVAIKLQKIETIDISQLFKLKKIIFRQQKQQNLQFRQKTAAKNKELNDQIEEMLIEVKGKYEYSLRQIDKQEKILKKYQKEQIQLKQQLKQKQQRLRELKKQEESKRQYLTIDD